MSAPPPAPTVSVLMATYNGAALVGETIASLRAQTMRDFELIVVDDCSTDGTPDVVRGFADARIRLTVASANRRVVVTRNAAFAQARGRYIAALDQDDLCHPERFARQVAYLDAHPDTVVLATAADVLADGAILPSALAALSTPAVIEWLLRIENPLVWSSVMLRADAARLLDPFMRPELVYAEDFDLYHRLAPLGRIARLDDVLLTYRRHGGGASQTQAAAMLASAGAVLADAYAPLFGEEAAATAALVVEHVMAQRPVRGREALARLGDVLVRLQDAFLAEHDPDPESRALIRWETARRWARIGRASLRAGRVTLGDTAAVRPAHLGLGYAGIEQLVLSRLVGGARATRAKVRRRLAG